MQFTIINAKMAYTKEDGYVGAVAFCVEGLRQPYELTLQSKRRQDWSYSLHFQNESGSEEEIVQVEEWLEEDDEAFDQMIEEAEKTLDAQSGN